MQMKEESTRTVLKHKGERSREMPKLKDKSMSGKIKNGEENSKRKEKSS